MNKRVIAGLDIGTTKIIAIVAECDENGYDIVGIGQHPSRGMRKGMVMNIDATVESIQNALRDAELMADCKIESVVTGIAGSNIRGFDSDGMVAIRDKEVKASDMERVIEMARAVAVPPDHSLLYVAPQEFVVDGQDGIREPLGMSGVRLEVHAHIVTASSSAVQNIVKCIRRCGLEVVDVMLQPIASSTAVLTEDERELGVILIDIGGGTTDIAVYTGGALRYTGGIPVAGEQITGDIAMALRIPTHEAEQIKYRYGVARQDMVDPADEIDIPASKDRAERTISRQVLAAVIEPRVEELFILVKEKLQESSVDQKMIKSGVVITGGVAALPGIVELAEAVLSEPCRVGVPHYDGSLSDIIHNPRYSTAVGLLDRAWEEAGRSPPEPVSVKRTLKSKFQSLKEWF